MITLNDESKPIPDLNSLLVLTSNFLLIHFNITSSNNACRRVRILDSYLWCLGFKSQPVKLATLTKGLPISILPPDKFHKTIKKQVTNASFHILSNSLSNTQGGAKVSWHLMPNNRKASSHIKWLLAQEYFIEFICYKSFKLYNRNAASSDFCAILYILWATEKQC